MYRIRGGSFTAATFIYLCSFYSFSHLDYNPCCIAHRPTKTTLHQPGWCRIRDRALLPRPLLRTHRAPFNAIGSSISKALLDRETRMSVTAHTSRYTCRAVAPFAGKREWAHQLTIHPHCVPLPPLCFPTLDGLPPFLVTRHPLEVCPLSRWGKS